MKVYLHLMCERVIDHGLGTMKLNVNFTFDLETWNLQGQGRRQRSRWKQLIKVYQHLMYERVIDHGLDTMMYNMSVTHLTLKLVTFKVKATDKGQDGKNSSRSIYILAAGWSSG